MNTVTNFTKMTNAKYSIAILVSIMLEPIPMMISGFAVVWAMVLNVLAFDVNTAPIWAAPIVAGIGIVFYVLMKTEDWKKKRLENESKSVIIEKYKSGLITTDDYLKALEDLK